MIPIFGFKRKTIKTKRISVYEINVLMTDRLSKKITSNKTNTNRIKDENGICVEFDFSKIINY
tara:strand:+ start:381 stop:569 length:189 start_codon:yes stop_codon:yes gene_type:complete